MFPYLHNNKAMIVISSCILILGMIFGGCGKSDKESGEPKFGTIIATHAIGLCNMPMFIMTEKQTAREFGVDIQLKYIPNWGDHAVALSTDAVQVSVTPFTNVITAYANGMPVKIIAGSGLNGLYLLGQPGLNSVTKLKGKKIGTYRSDTLEMIAYDALRKAGLGISDFQMVYFTDGFALMTAFANKTIDAMTQVEPYATQAVRMYGAEVIAKGQDVWGGTHPDCVLVTNEKTLKNRRDALKAVIAGMLRAEAYIEQHYGEAVDMCVGKYYKTDRNDIFLAGQSQPPGIDIRDKVQFIIDRSKSLMELGYISAPVDSGLIDFSLLREVINEHPDLLSAVKVRADIAH